MKIPITIKGIPEGMVAFERNGKDIYLHMLLGDSVVQLDQEHVEELIDNLSAVFLGKSTQDRVVEAIVDRASAMYRPLLVNVLRNWLYPTKTQSVSVSPSFTGTPEVDL